MQERTEEISWLNNQLEQGVAELETIMQVLPVGVAVTQDPACMEIIANPALNELLGVSPGHSLRQGTAAKGESPYMFYEQGKPLEWDARPLHHSARTGKQLGSLELEVRRAEGAAAGFAYHAADAWLLSRVEGPGGSGAA